MSIPLRRAKLEEGIHLNYIFNEEFNTNIVNIYFVMPLDRKNVTPNVLLPLVLKRGINNSLVQRKFKEFPGSNLNIRLLKEGEKQVISFAIEGPRLKNADKKALKELIDILKFFIYKPYPIEDVFSQESVLKEKENLRKIIEGRVRDIKLYSYQRCTEEMYKNENFSIYPFGYIEDLDIIDNQNIYEHYIKILNQAVIEIFCIGEFDDDLLKYTMDAFNRKRSNVLKLNRESITGNVQIKKMIYEYRNIEPGYLVIGYRSGIPYESPLYNGLVVASNLLASKLVQSFSKSGMNYNINFILDKYKSCILVEGNVLSRDFEKVVEIIRMEVENIKEGSITEEEIFFSKKIIRADIKSIYEDKHLLSDFYFSNILMKDYRNLEEIFFDLDKINKEDIIQASQGIKADTIYFIGEPI